MKTGVVKSEEKILQEMHYEIGWSVAYHCKKLNTIKSEMFDTEEDHAYSIAYHQQKFDDYSKREGIIVKLRMKYGDWSRPK